MLLKGYNPEIPVCYIVIRFKFAKSFIYSGWISIFALLPSKLITSISKSIFTLQLIKDSHSVHACCVNKNIPSYKHENQLVSNPPNHSQIKITFSRKSFSNLTRLHDFGFVKTNNIETKPRCTYCSLEKRILIRCWVLFSRKFRKICLHRPNTIFY